MNLLNYMKNVWVLNNPTVIYRSARGFVRALIFHKNTLKTIEIFPTHKCNLKCSMCSVSKYKKVEERALDLDDYRRLAREGARLGTIAVTILGGEPMLAKNLGEIISIFKREKFFVYMVTNGLLVTDENLKKLHDSGLNSICFSLDSMDEKVCEEIRGVKGYVKKVLGAVAIAQKVGLTVNLAPVFFHNRLKDGIDVIKYCKKHKLGASGGQVATVGGAENSEILTPAEHACVRELLRFYPRLTFDWSLSYFLKMRCPAGKEKIAVTTYGDVVGCSVNPISFGNIKEEPLEIILERMGKFSQFAKDSPVCLTAEDTYYIDNYLKPLKNFNFYPVNFKDHPKITEEVEKEVYLIGTDLKNQEANISMTDMPMENTVCPLCGANDYDLENRGQDYEYWPSEKYFQFVSCRNCRHLYQNPRPGPEAAKIIYPKNYSSFIARHAKDKFGIIGTMKKKIMIRRLLPLKEYFKPGCHVLEIGCGDGQLLLALTRMINGLKCTGVDIYFTDTVKKELQEAGINVVQGRIEDVNLPVRKYHLIIMNQLIEHLWDLKGVMNKLKKALVPGGCLSIETINIDGYDRRFFKDGCWGGYFFPRHMNLFNFTSLKRLMENHELIVEKQCSLLAPICWIFSCHAWLQKKYGKNNIISKFFTDANPLTLAIFTIVEIVAIKMGAISSNQKVIARKAH